jgi:phage protein D
VAHSYQILLDGSPVPTTIYGAIDTLQIEENAEQPGAMELRVPISRGDSGDLTLVNEAPFQPFANLAVVVTAQGKTPECIFDGFVLSHKIHLDQGAVTSTLTVWGQDVSWLMNLEEKAREWNGDTDGDIANAIFADYGFATAPENTDNDSPAHTDDGHTLMQRASDIQFLRALARKNGKLCRVACGAQAGQRTGYFAKPNLEGDPVATISLQSPDGARIEGLDFEWDVTRPTLVEARQALFNDSDQDGVAGDTGDSGLPLLAARSLGDFSGRAMTVLLTTTVDDANELQLRTASVLREGGFFAKCTGQIELEVLGSVMRVGTLARVTGAGALCSGDYFVWSVRHTITPDKYTMKFVLVRNAVGAAPAGGGPVAGLV